MNKEEKEAIKHLIDMSNLSLIGDGTVIVQNETIATILNLIQKQESIIDKMAEHLADIIINDDNASLLPFYDYQENLKEEVKEYFKKVVDEDGRKENKVNER